MFDLLKISIALWLFSRFFSSLNLNITTTLAENPTTAILCVFLAVVGIVLPLILRRK